MSRRIRCQICETKEKAARIDYCRENPNVRCMWLSKEVRIRRK